MDERMVAEQAKQELGALLDDILGTELKKTGKDLLEKVDKLSMGQEKALEKVGTRLGDVFKQVNDIEEQLGVVLEGLSAIEMMKRQVRMMIYFSVATIVLLAAVTVVMLIK